MSLETSLILLYMIAFILVILMYLLVRYFEEIISFLHLDKEADKIEKRLAERFIAQHSNKNKVEG